MGFGKEIENVLLESPPPPPVVGSVPSSMAMMNPAMTSTAVIRSRTDGTPLTLRRVPSTNTHKVRSRQRRIIPMATLNPSGRRAKIYYRPLTRKVSMVRPDNYYLQQDLDQQYYPRIFYEDKRTPSIEEYRIRLP